MASSSGCDKSWRTPSSKSTDSKSEGIERGSFATVQTVDTPTNTVTVSLESGSIATYDPRRLKGVNVFREVEGDFAAGDRVQFTAPNNDLGVANRDLWTVVGLEKGEMTLRMDGKSARIVAFHTEEFRQFDHGYAVTSRRTLPQAACSLTSTQSHLVASLTIV